MWALIILLYSCFTFTNTPCCTAYWSKLDRKEEILPFHIAKYSISILYNNSIA